MDTIMAKATYIHQDELGKVLFIIDQYKKLHVIEMDEHVNNKTQQEFSRMIERVK